MFNFNPSKYTESFKDYESAYAYLDNGGIPTDKLIECSDQKKLIKPNLIDLARLFKICRAIKPNRIIEYGCGFSSYIFNYYLSNFDINIDSKKKLHIIEVHRKYLQHALSRFEEGKINIDLTSEICPVILDTKRDDGSHKYLVDYKFTPDLIYLDGPDPADITNTKFTDGDQRVPISSDLLTIESWLIPGTIIIVDGRIANVRYLKNNLQREWHWNTSVDNDCSIGILNESPLGKKNLSNLKKRGLI